MTEFNLLKMTTCFGVLGANTSTSKINFGCEVLRPLLEH